METAAVFKSAHIAGIPATALFSVSDVSAPAKKILRLRSLRMT
jgi:nucleoside phosphorylase